MRKTICDKCGKEIEIKDDYYAVIEQLENISSDRTVNVKSSKEIATYCTKCHKAN